MTLEFRITFYTSSKINMVLIIREKFISVKEDFMLLAVGIIAASAFIQNHECWSQVCTTEQGQSWSEFNKAFPHQLKNTETVCTRGARIQELHGQSRREGWKTRVGCKCFHFMKLEIEAHVPFPFIILTHCSILYGGNK